MEKDIKRDRKVEIVRKWYYRLALSGEYDDTFEEWLAGERVEIRDYFTDNAAENLLSALYQCEALEQKFEEWGIDRSILDATLLDIKIWTDIWHGLTGELGLMETGWMKNHFSGRLFRLGRLQFYMGRARHDIPERNIEKGMPVLDIHIPRGEALYYEACRESIKEAIKFFEEKFPEFQYRCITCHSWLLAPTIRKFLKKESNILAFQSLFDIVSTEESDAALRFVLGWDTDRENLATKPATSGLAEKIKDYALRGGKFYVPYAIVDESGL